MSMLLDAMKRGLYENVIIGPAVSNLEARKRGLAVDNTIGLRLEGLYEKHVTEDPEAYARRLWTAETVGVPKWIQDEDEMYAKEAEKRASLLTKGIRDWEKFSIESPLTAKFFDNDDVMASASDDADALAAKEMEARRAGAVASALRGRLSRGGAGRMAAAAAMKKMPVVYRADDDPRTAGHIYRSEADRERLLSLGRPQTVPAEAPAITKEDAERHAGEVQEALRGKLRGGAGRRAAVSAAKSVPAIFRADPETRKFSEDAASIFNDFDKWISGTAWWKGVAAGYETSSIGSEAVGLFTDENFSGRQNQEAWVGLYKRMLALDRDKPDDWLPRQFYSTGKFLGQQAAGAWTTGLLGAEGAAMGAWLGATAGTALPSAAYFSMGAESLMGTAGTAAAVTGAAPLLPALGIGAGAGAGALMGVAGAGAMPPLVPIILLAAAGLWLGTKMGVFWQSAKTEAGLDLLERRNLTDAEGNHLSNFSIGLGSMATGAINGALELFEWQMAGRPFANAARRVMEKETLSAVSAAVTRRLVKLPAFVRMGALFAKDVALNDFTESATEVLQDLVPITIDEMQKHYLLGDFDRRTLGEINAQLTDTFTSSTEEFFMTSLMGPGAAFGGSLRNRNGYYRMELARRELEAAETQRLNRTLDTFAERMLATKLFKRFPGMSEAHTEEMLKDADLSRAYMPASAVETLYQEAKKDGDSSAASYESAKAWAEDVFGIDAADYDASMEDGHRMELAAAKVFEEIGESEAAREVLRKDMSWMLGGMTVSEAEEAKKNIDELRRDDFFRFRASYEHEQQEELSARRVYEASAMQLEAEGVDSETASAWAWTKSRMYIQLARMYSDAMPGEAEKAARKAGRTLGRFLPEDIERMFPMVIERGEDGTLKGVTFRDDSMTALAQPMNADVDVKQPVKVIIAAPKFDNESAFAVRNGKERSEFSSSLSGVYHNDATGWDIKLPSSSVKHSISSAVVNEAVDYKTSVEIISQLPDVIKNAVLIESHDDDKNAFNVEKIHRMYAPVSFDNGKTVYVVKLTVKEMDGTYDTAVEGIYKAHDAKGVKEISDAKPQRPAQEEHPTGNTPDIYEITIEEMLRGVKDNDGISYLQSVWHGSPFNFDRFSLEHIGSGEGAQVYGWGLYFAGEKEVSEWYRKKEARKRGSQNKGQLYQVDIPDEADGNYLLWDKEVTKEQAERIAKAMLEKGLLPKKELLFKGKRLGIGSFGDAELKKIAGGQVYGFLDMARFSIKKDAEDGDLPNIIKLSRKSWEDTIKREGTPAFDRQVKEAREALEWLDENEKNITVGDYSGETFLEKLGSDTRGKKVYAKVSKMAGSDKAASMLLKNAGFAGIKYLDGASRFKGEGSYNYVIFDDNAVEIMETYYQEAWRANAAEIKDTILKQEAFPVERDTAVIPGELRRGYRNGVAGTNRNLKYLLASILPQVVSTKAVGDVLISKSSIKNDLYHSRGGMKLDSLTVIDKLLSDAVKIGEENIKKGRENVTTHVLARKALWDNDDYIVVMAVNEDNTGKLFYDHKMTEIVDLNLLSSGVGQNGGQTGHKEKAHRGLINILAEDIWLGKANDENIYLNQQIRGQQARGSITLPSYDGAPVRITLGKDADKSTFVHELGHLYLWHMKRLAGLDAVQNRASWNGPASRWNADLKVVSGWWDEQAEDIARQAAEFMSGDGKDTLSAEGFRNWLAAGMETQSEAGRAYSRSAQEYFARGFEKYLAEGKAPSRELQGVFRRFKQWLCDIYKSLTELDVELSDEIRDVFDRMLATEEAVERLRASRELDEALSAMLPEGDEETMGYPYDFGDDPYEAAKEQLLTGLLDNLTPARRKAMADRAEELRPEIIRAVAQEPGYVAMDLMEDNPDMRLSADAVLDEFGEQVVAAMPEGTLADGPGEGMTDLEVAAKALGFESARDMIDAIAGRRTVREEIEARVREAVAAEFSDESMTPKALDVAAEAALYETDDAGERIAAEAEADFAKAAEEAGAAEAQEEAEERAEPEFADDEESRAYHEAYRDIFEADEAAKAEREDPRSRKNVIAWIRRSGGLNYKAVVAAVGQEQARELLQKVDPGLFRKDATLGLDTAAQELSGLGIVFESDESLYNLLMKDPAALSPIELAAAEARKETIKEFRDKYKALSEKLRSEAAEEKKEGKSELAALKEKLKEQYKERTEKLRDKYQKMTERQRAEFAERKQRDRESRAAARMKAALKKQVEKSVNRKETARAARVATKNAASAMTVQQLYDVSGWVRTEKDSRAAADKALRAHDENGYRAAKRRELYAHEMVRAMYQARSRAEYMRKRLAEYQGRGQKRTFGMTPEYLRQLDAMLSRLVLDRQKKAADILALTREDMTAQARSLEAFIKEQAEDGVPIMVPDWLLKSDVSRRYESFVMYELEEIYNAAQNIVQTGRDEKKTIARGRNIELAGIDAQVLSRAQGYYGKKKVNGETVIEVAKKDPKLLPDFIADLDTAEAMCRALDGYEDFGPMQDFVFRPVREAVSREYAELNRVFGLFRDLKIKVYGTDFKVDIKARDIGVPEYTRRTDMQTGKPYHVPSGKMSMFTKENIICAAFNMGNADNIARLKDGWGWTDSDIEKIKEQMTEKDWQYVQGVWDLLDTMWPQIRKVHELMTGTTIEKVEAQKVSTKYGELRGGYYPIVTDPRYSERAAAQNEQQEVMASVPLDYAQKHTKSGHRKARADSVLGRPPILTFAVLDNHIANVIHDYELSPVVRDVRKILSRDTVRSVVKSVLGERGIRNFNHWLNDIAANTKNNGVTSGPGDRTIQAIKSNTAMFALGANLGGALMQPLGYFPLAHRIGFANTAMAIMDWLAHPQETFDFCREHSAFMREQLSDSNSEVRKLRQNWTTNDHGISKAADMMLSIYPMLQNMCNAPGWVRCYKMGLKKYGSEAKAVAYADSIIRQTQSASTIADLSTFERSGTIGQMMTMFYSWFRVMYQMQNEAIRKVKYEHGLFNKTKTLASYTLYVLIAQSVAEALLRRSGPDPDDDDPYKWARWTAGRLLLAPLSTVPVAREVGNFFDSNFRYGVTLSPVQSSLDSIGRALATIWKQGGKIFSEDDVEWGKTAEAAATLAGYRYGVPNRAMIRAAKAFLAYFNEDEAIPWLYLLLGGGYRPKD